MEVYSLTRLGRRFAHNRRSPRTPGWGVIHFLSKYEGATAEQIFSHVDGANGNTLHELRRSKIIMAGTREGM